MNSIYVCDDEHIIWARGPNCWGRAKTRKEAIRLGRKAGGGVLPKGFRKWQITLVPIDSEIDLGDGYLSWHQHTCDVLECRSYQLTNKSM